MGIFALANPTSLSLNFRCEDRDVETPKNKDRMILKNAYHFGLSIFAWGMPPIFSDALYLVHCNLLAVGDPAHRLQNEASACSGDFQAPCTNAPLDSAKTLRQDTGQRR